MLCAWQVELMEQNARNQQLEELNAPDPNEEQRNEAAADLKRAIESLKAALEAVTDAVTAIDGLVEANEVESFEEPISELTYGLKRMQNKIRYAW